MKVIFPFLNSSAFACLRDALFAKLWMGIEGRYIEIINFYPFNREHNLVAN